MTRFLVRKLDEMRGVLLDEAAAGPSEIYYVVRLEGKRFGPEPNITIIPPARIGREYPKTYGHYHEHGEGETYRVLYGIATLLVQKPVTRKHGRGGNTEILDIRMLTGKVGETLKVPEGYGHCLINATDDLLVTADWEAETAGHVYEPIRRMRGFGYYLIEGEDSKPQTIPNPHYKNLPPLKI